MIKKKFLNDKRIRRISGGFSFIPHRFLTDGFFTALDQHQLLLYFFLVLVSDRYGLTLTTRKNGRPAKLPIPENIMKALAAYIIGSRPKSSHRRLFLNLVAPYHPILPVSVGQHITECIRKAGLPGSAYWLPAHPCAESFGGRRLHFLSCSIPV